MALYDKASLVLIPSGTKAGTVYSQKPTDGDGDFDFTRSSYATRVNSQGLIEKERSNLLLQSNSFDTTWGAPAGGISTPTSGQTGYDGTSDAWLLSKTASGHSRLIQTISSSGLKTFSLYAKEGTLKMVRLLALGGGNPEAHFNLNTGNIDVVDSDVIASNMQSVGSGWYRCSISFDDTITEVRIYPLEAQGDTTTLGNIYIQDAQVEQGLVATDYIETTTSAVYEGITDNVPRLDYDGDCPSLLLEPQRQNKMAYSEGLKVDLGIQYKSPSVTLTPNSAESPDGNNNATKFDGGINNVADSYVGYTASTTHSFSLFLKAGTCDIVKMKHTATGSVAEITINLTSGTITNTTGAQYLNSSIVDYGNGWYRASITFTSGTTGYITRAQLGEAGYIYMYGWQLEQGSYATSYIPTYGTSVTRNGDSCFLQNADVHSSGAGTIFFEVGDYDTNTSASGFNKILVFDEVGASSLDNLIYFEEYAGNNTILLRKGGNNLLQSTPNYQDLRGSKIAIKWSSEEAKIFIDGVINNTYVGDASLQIQYFGFDNPYNGDIVSTIKMKQIVGFPTPLTDQQCIDLTT